MSTDIIRRQLHSLRIPEDGNHRGRLSQNVLNSDSRSEDLHLSSSSTLAPAQLSSTQLSERSERVVVFTEHYYFDTTMCRFKLLYLLSRQGECLRNRSSLYGLISTMLPRRFTVFIPGCLPCGTTRIARKMRGPFSSGRGDQITACKPKWGV